MQNENESLNEKTLKGTSRENLSNPKFIVPKTTMDHKHMNLYLAGIKNLIHGSFLRTWKIRKTVFIFSLHCIYFIFRFFHHIITFYINQTH